MHPSVRRRVQTTGRMVAREPAWLRWLLIFIAVATVVWLIVVPLVYVFVHALEPGFKAVISSLWDDDSTWQSILLTLVVAPLAVLFNTIFGIAAAWAITKFRFPGRTVLITLLDMPFAISPVVAGLMFILIFGRDGFIPTSVQENWGFKIVFAWPGIVLVTTFVTLPFVARELIPLMESLGSEEELAAISLGANSWQMFWRITLPNIKWGLLYGMVQCNARAIGEYGAVYVMSGRVEGQTDTVPLRIEKLFIEFRNADMYALAAMLALIAVLTLVGKIYLEHRAAAELSAMTDGDTEAKETHS